MSPYVNVCVCVHTEREKHIEGERGREREMVCEKKERGKERNFLRNVAS